MFFHLNWVKWSIDHALYLALEPCDSEDYLIREACHDHPSLESEGNEGLWVENPWEVSVQIQVSIGFLDVEEGPDLPDKE